MKCLECGAERPRIDNEHLLQCSGLTVQEYAIRQHLPLDLVLQSDQVNLPDAVENYPASNTSPTEAARATLLGLRWSGLVVDGGEFCEIPGEIRRLDLLLWDLNRLSGYGFRFKQEYEYSAETHRVVAKNRLRTAMANLKLRVNWATPEPPPSFIDAFAVYIAHVAELHGGYLFMQFPNGEHAKEVRTTLRREHGIQLVMLDATDENQGMLLRTRTLADCARLFALLADRLKSIPDGWERFHAETPVATITKELVFDAAHFITDHPAKCSNLHGGRYLLQVQVRDRIDPVTGCVVDYGYLKRVVNHHVIERFDHHHLNYAAVELAWRSSTEMICAYIWELLIDYLPGLNCLRLYETTQSWCDYQGPTLAMFQAHGTDAVLQPFAQLPDGEARRRQLLGSMPALHAVVG